jgi:hypothetical protein
MLLYIFDKYWDNLILVTNMYGHIQINLLYSTLAVIEWVHHLQITVPGWNLKHRTSAVHLP